MNNGAMLKKSRREMRGEVTGADTLPYRQLTKTELLELLQASDARLRSIAAILLGERRSDDLVRPLCLALQHEKALYPRIAISETLSLIGEVASGPLSELLGVVGDNQETMLPLKCCDKKSYPLVRDLAGRTLVKIGKPAVPFLIRSLKTGDIRQIKEAIDVLGAIASKTGDTAALPSILQIMDTLEHDDFLLWKLTRALGGFRHFDAAARLILILRKHAQPALRWEAARSLGQIGIVKQEIIDALRQASEDKHPEVRRASITAMKQLAGVDE